MAATSRINMSKTKKSPTEYSIKNAQVGENFFITIALLAQQCGHALFSPYERVQIPFVQKVY